MIENLYVQIVKLKKIEIFMQLKTWFGYIIIW